MKPKPRRLPFDTGREVKASEPWYLRAPGRWSEPWRWRAPPDKSEPSRWRTPSPLERVELDEGTGVEERAGEPESTEYRDRVEYWEGDQLRGASRGIGKRTDGGRAQAAYVESTERLERAVYAESTAGSGAPKQHETTRSVFHPRRP